MVGIFGFLKNRLELTSGFCFHVPQNRGALDPAWGFVDPA
jgi:hypothetical protein